MKPLRPLSLVLLCSARRSSPPTPGATKATASSIASLPNRSPPTCPPSYARPEALNEIEYLGPEPDRWRSRAEPELNAAQAPDHFIDLEYADLIGPLPRQRYEYIAALYAYAAAHPDRAADLRPEKVGLQPYITTEVWERLKSAFRDYRTLSAASRTPNPSKPRSSSTPAGSATMSPTARSPSTSPSSTTAGSAPIPTATPPSTTSTRSSNPPSSTPPSTPPTFSRS